MLPAGAYKNQSTFWRKVVALGKLSNKKSAQQPFDENYDVEEDDLGEKVNFIMWINLFPCEGEWGGYLTHLNPAWEAALVLTHLSSKKRFKC